MLAVVPGRRDEWRELWRLGGRDVGLLREVEREWWVVEVPVAVDIDRDTDGRGVCVLPVAFEFVGESGSLYDFDLGGSIRRTLGVSISGDEGSDRSSVEYC